MNSQPSPAKRNVITSAAFARQFGHLRQSATLEPLFISHHGRETHVLLSVDAYRDLTEASTVTTEVAGEVGVPTIDDVIQWMHDGCVILDHDGTIVRANQVAQAMTRKSDAELLGRPLYDAMPELRGSLVQSYINRSMASRERCMVDLPSIFRDNAWSRLEVYPAVGSTTLIFHDITDDVIVNRLADPKTTLVAAMEAHGEVGMIRLDVRGRIETVDDWCVSLLGLARERLVGVAIYDLIPLPLRAGMRERLDVVRGGGARIGFETQVLSKSGEVIPIRGGAAELHGA